MHCPGPSEQRTKSSKHRSSWPGRSRALRGRRLPTRTREMAQYIVETPGQATSHDEQWSTVAKLVKLTLEQSQREVLDVETGRTAGPLALVPGCVSAGLLPRRKRLCSRAGSATRLPLKTRNMRITKLKPVTTSRNVLIGVYHAFNCGDHAERKSYRPDGRGRGLCFPLSRPCRASPAQLSTTNCRCDVRVPVTQRALLVVWLLWRNAWLHGTAPFCSPCFGPWGPCLLAACTHVQPPGSR